MFINDEKVPDSWFLSDSLKSIFLALVETGTYDEKEDICFSCEWKTDRQTSRQKEREKKRKRERYRVVRLNHLTKTVKGIEERNELTTTATTTTRMKMTITAIQPTSSPRIRASSDEGRHHRIPDGKDRYHANSENQKSRRTISNTIVLQWTYSSLRFSRHWSQMSCRCWSLVKKTIR